MAQAPAVFRVQFNSLLRNFTRLRGDINAWNLLIDNLPSVSFHSPHSTTTVEIDWKDSKEFIVERNSQYFDSTEINTKEKYDGMIEKMNEYIRRSEAGLVRKDLEIELSVYSSDVDEFRDMGYVINVLYQIFLTMNLAIPGSCDFYSVEVHSNSLEASNFSKKKRLWLAGSTFEGAIESQKRLGWQILQDLPILKVLQWIQRIGVAESNFARSTTERAIYGMLHVCNQPDLSPSEVVWLAQALEALFDTPKAGISKILRDRIFLVLGEPTENLKKIKKAINTFYDYRSRYVHGEIEIPNPMSIRLSDSSLDKFQEELMEHIDFAMLLIVSALQRLILLDGSAFEFLESVSIQ
ncbi:MAG: hypothetical protein ACAF41_14140 [Leptolyngbya sp. BL-A-14]